MLNIFQNSYRRIFNVHFAVQGPYTMNHSLPLFLICFLHKSFPKWCKVFVDDDFLFLPRLELQWRHLTKFQILKCFLNLFSSCKVLIWSCHYIINFTIIAVSHLHYLFIYLFIYLPAFLDTTLPRGNVHERDSGPMRGAIPIQSHNP